MATEKDTAFLKYLIAATENGKIAWEPSALDEQYVAGFKGKYQVTIERGQIDRDGDTPYILQLTNASDGRELLSMSDFNIRPNTVGNLFQLAQRSALNVDAAIDEIMEEGKDIPF